MLHQRGFTFIELLIVLTVLGAIVVSFKPYIDNRVLDARRDRMIQRMLHIAEVAEHYRLRVADFGFDSNDDYYRTLYELPAEGPNQMNLFNQMADTEFPERNFAGRPFQITNLSANKVTVHTTLPASMDFIAEDASHASLRVTRQGSDTRYAVSAAPGLDGNRFYLRRARFLKRMVEERRPQ